MSQGAILVGLALLLAAPAVVVAQDSEPPSRLPAAGPPVCAVVFSSGPSWPGSSTHEPEPFVVQSCTHRVCLPDHAAVGHLSFVGLAGASAQVSISCGGVVLAECAATLLGDAVVVGGLPVAAASCLAGPVPQVPGEYAVHVQFAGPVLAGGILDN